MKKVILLVMASLALSSCAESPYIMAGIAQGLAETTYQLEMENRRQRLENARIDRTP